MAKQMSRAEAEKATGEIRDYPERTTAVIRTLSGVETAERWRTDMDNWMMSGPPPSGDLSWEAMMAAAPRGRGLPPRRDCD